MRKTHVLNLNQFRNWIWWVFWGKFNELFGHVQLKTKTVEVKAKWVSDRVNFYCAQIISTQCNCTANTPKWVKWEEVCAFFSQKVKQQRPEQHICLPFSYFALRRSFIPQSDKISPALCYEWTLPSHEGCWRVTEFQEICGNICVW